MTQVIDKLAWLYIQNKQLLSTRSKGKDALYLPGGKREPGESDEAALMRELKEELTIDLLPGTIKFYGTFQAQAHGRSLGTEVKITCYQGTFQGEIRAAAEIAEADWITTKDRARCSLTLQLVLDDLSAKHLIM